MIAELKQKIDSLESDKKKINNGVDLAIEITGYKKSTIYNLVNQRVIPHSKKRGKLTFDKQILLSWWTEEGRRLTISEASKAA